MSGLILELLDLRLAICRLGSTEAVPAWVLDAALYSVTRTPDELSVIAPQSAVPDGVRSERGFRVLKVQGPLDFSLTGILASLSAPLAEAGVSLFALSTFDTDYLLIPEAKLGRAVDALSAAGHSVRRPLESPG